MITDNGESFTFQIDCVIYSQINTNKFTGDSLQLTTFDAYSDLYLFQHNYLIYNNEHLVCIHTFILIKAWCGLKLRDKNLYVLCKTL